MSQERAMPGVFGGKSKVLITLFVFAAVPLFAQVAPQGYPQQEPSGQIIYPQGAADGGDPAAQTQGDPGPGVARISLLNGDVSVRRGDSGDYVAANQNAPVMVQDSLQTGAGARGEVQFDAASMIRLAQNTEVHFTDLQPGRTQMQLGRGTVTFRIFRDSNSQVEIDTPSVSVRPTRMGIYRITVTDDAQTYITPRLGQVEVYTPKGSQMVEMGQTMMARGASADPEFQMIGALNRDEWDAWSDSRDQGMQRAWANIPQSVPQGVYGTEDLAGHGNWVNTPDYGYAWVPSVSSDWAPYSAGRWAWEDYYGWTWVSYDPWGWAPYHYGRWFFRSGLGWAWWPGTFGARAFWSPALVGFCGFGPGFGGIGFGRIGWVPLAPFEAFHPWWGRGAVGGTAVFHNTTFVNSYRNARVANGVMAMNANSFGRGATGISRVGTTELRTASAFHGSVPVRPTSQSLRFSDRTTSTVAHTDFSQSRFASHMTPSAVQRTPFGRAASGAAGRSFNNNGNSGSSFNRYSTSPGSSTSSVQGARAFGSTPGTRNIPQSSSSSGGWNRFGATTGSGFGSSGYRGSSYGTSTGRSQLQISPPIVRERGNAPATQQRPASSYSGPRYSAPTYSAPHYNAPTGGGSSSHPSGGGGHPSSGGGGGGHHR
jgi:hypothetical protein